MRFMKGSRFGLPPLAPLLLAAALLAAGCAAPQTSGSFAERGAVNTGTFPNLNVAPPVATTQFSQYSLEQHNAQIAAAQQGQAAEGAAAATAVGESQADAARLKQLNETHGKSTLQVIEGN